MFHFLSSSLTFPAVETANEEGLVAIGGDLSSARLLLAYASGIFPWYEDSYPILWWSPDPRMILRPQDIVVSHSLRQRINRSAFEIRIDTAFNKVIRHCATIGDRTIKGTWITPEMIEAYKRLYEEGFAHSFEAWSENRLVGGLYGVSLGRAFFGESMFYIEPEASKVALVFLARLLHQLGFHFIDVQQETSHLQSMGAVSIPRVEFIRLLKNALENETITGKWTKFGNRKELLTNLPI